MTHRSIGQERFGLSNDGKADPQALPDNPGEVFADSAYRGNHFCDAVREFLNSGAGGLSQESASLTHLFRLRTAIIGPGSRFRRSG